MKVGKIALLSFLLINSTAVVSAQNYTSGNKLVHVQKALMPQGGTLNMYNSMSAFGEAAGGGGAIWDIRNTILIDYSFTENFLLSGNLTVYQDLNDGSGTAATPISDFGLTFKAASLKFGDDSFVAGGLINFQLPVGDSYKQNVPFSIYRGIGPSLQVVGLISYYTDNLFPEDAFSAHLNLGVGTYFDKDKDILFLQSFPKNSKPLKSDVSPVDMKYAFGVELPTDFIDLYTEIWGNFFIKKPGANYFAKEDYGYITAGVGLKPVDLLLLNVSADFLIVGSDNKSTYELRPNDFITLPSAGSDNNYAPWRINVGLKINILPFKTAYTIDPSKRYDISEREADEIRRRVRIIEEDEAVTRDKVETLRAKRKDVESNLKQLRDLLKQLDTQGGEGN